MASERRIGSDIPTKSSSREAAIAVLAERQHGVVSRAQLLAVGVGAGAIKHRHRARRREGWWMAAVLAGGPGTVPAGRSAAALWRMRVSARPAIEVISPRRRVAGLRRRAAVRA